MKCSVAALLALVVCTGCTTQSLRRHTLSQVESVADLRYREVMENLAIVDDNPAALPTHTSIYTGSTDITDTIPVTAGLSWVRTIPKIGAAFTAFSTGSLDFATSRGIKKNWTLDPTVAPEKVYALRCACWWVLFGENNQLGDSRTLDVYDTHYPPGMYFEVANDLRNLPPDWLHVGKLADVPLRACYRGVCGNHVVWVEPNGMEGLSRFTLVLQTIARASVSSATHPSAKTTAVVLQGGRGADAAGTALISNPQVTKVTVYIDGNGYATPGENTAAIPVKVRQDNVGSDTELKSSITAASRGP
jgi:hypothetical protein